MNISNKRLFEVFDEQSQDFYKTIENKDQKSEHWKTRYGLKKFTIENLINFRSNDLSEGLDDSATEIAGEFPFRVYAEVVNQTSEEYVLSNLPKKNIGNSKALIKYKNIFLDYNKLIHIHWFNDVEKNVLKNNQISNFCEIGGGFGSFAELFIRNYNLKFLSIDLPEANLMSSYYLKENFPDKSFYLYDDYKNNNSLSYEDFLANDIIILPPNLDIDPKIKIDFFINSRSMMEMNFTTIKSYFSLIQKHVDTDGFFLNINRYEKTSVGEKIRISEYPYDENWNVINSKPSFEQNWVHFLLAKRNIIKQEQNIKTELEKIKKIESSYYGKYIDNNPSSAKNRLRKLLKLIFGKKLLVFLGNFLIFIGNKLKRIN
jgi:putative sugar O-methyltransferase